MYSYISNTCTVVYYYWLESLPSMPNHYITEGGIIMLKLIKWTSAFLVNSECTQNSQEFRPYKITYFTLLLK